MIETLTKEWTTFHFRYLKDKVETDKKIEFTNNQLKKLVEGLNVSLEIIAETRKELKKTNEKLNDYKQAVENLHLKPEEKKSLWERILNKIKNNK